MTEAQVQLREMLGASQQMVGFTGAGISTESGIPDFRSPGGFWTQHKPIDFKAFTSSAEMRREAWRRYFSLRESVEKARPSRAHVGLAQLVAQGRMGSIITQNIDNLHQAAGVPDAHIIELHGNGSYARCLSCGVRHELSFVRVHFEAEGEPPDCTQCGGLLKSATISFGQPMPELEMQRAREAISNADLMIAMGSSLVVQPAAQFTLTAKRYGCQLVIINREPTGYDAYADLVIHADIGDTLQSLGLA
jgi:NAD-dependent deacetylase